VAVDKERGRAFVAVDREPASLLRVDLDTGARSPFAELSTSPDWLAVSDDGARLAALKGTFDSTAAPVLALVPTAGGPVVEKSLEPGGWIRDLVWAGGDGPVVVRMGRSDAPDAVEAYDGSLALVGCWSGWNAMVTAGEEGRLYGLDLPGRLRTADPVEGKPSEAAAFKSVSFRVLAVVPSDAFTAAAPVEHKGDEEASPLLLLGAVAVGAGAAGVVIAARRRRRRGTVSVP
jgi:hypothetical protein